MSTPDQVRGRLSLENALTLEAEQLCRVGLVQGTKSLSAWIRTPDGQPAAAITLSAIRNRLGPRRVIEVADALVTTARAIEAATPRG